MRVLVTSRSPSERQAAWELALAGDDVIREINLDATFDKVLQQRRQQREPAPMGKGMLGKGIRPRFIPLPSIPLPTNGNSG